MTAELATEREQNAAEGSEPENGEPPEGLAGERDWYQSVGPHPGPGDSDGGGSD